MRRRPVIAVAVIFGLAVAVGLGVWKLNDSSSTSGACDLYGEDADAIVFWSADDAPELAAVQGVDTVEERDPAQTWAHVNGTATDAGVAPAGFPASVAVTFTEAGWEDVRRVQEDLTDAPWSRAVVARDEPDGPFHEVVTDRWGGVDLVVFLQPGTELGSLELMASDLAAAEGVEAVEVFTQEQAYDEFADLFADQPELVSTVSPELLPASVRVTMTDPGNTERTEELATSVEVETDVREVTLPLSSTLFGDPLLAEFADGC